MFEIEKISLLTKKEYMKYKADIPQFFSCWWLLNSDINKNNVYCVNRNGGIYNYNIRQTLYVRPVLHIVGLSDEHEVREKIKLFGFNWTIINIKNEKAILLCDTYIDERRFDPKSNRWEDAEIKLWLEAWLHDKLREKRENLNI